MDSRLLRPWGFLGKSTGVGCHSLLQGIFPTQWSNPGLPHCRQTLYRLSHQGSPSLTKQSKGTSAINLSKMDWFLQEPSHSPAAARAWRNVLGWAQRSAPRPCTAHRSSPALFLASLVTFHYQCFSECCSCPVKRPEMVQSPLCLYTTFSSEMSTKNGPTGMMTSSLFLS